MCQFSGQQPVVLGVVAFFSDHFISNTFRIIRAIPSKQGFCNASIVKSISNFSIHFSRCFVTVPNAPITTGITLLVYLFHFPNFCNFILQITIICAFFFSMRVSKGRAGSINRHFLLFFSIAVISGRLYSRVSSVCIGKSIPHDLAFLRL